MCQQDNSCDWSRNSNIGTQQSSDITYRVYDYDRVGKDGKKRELHLERSLAVTNVPHEDPQINRAQVFEAG